MPPCPMPPSAAEAAKATGRCTCRIQRLIAGLVLLILLIVAIQETQTLTDFRTWLKVQDGATIVLLLLVVLIVDVVPVVGHPIAKVVQLVLPFAFEPLQAGAMLVAYVFVYCMACFYLGRKWCRGPVNRLLRAEWPEASRVKFALDRALSRSSGRLRLVVLMRLMPLPEALASYLLSLTDVGLLEYTVASAVEAVKSTLITLYIAFNIQTGSAALLGGGDSHEVDWGMLLMLGLAAGLLVVGVRFLHQQIKRELDDAASDDEGLV